MRRGRRGVRRALRGEKTLLLATACCRDRVRL